MRPFNSASFAWFPKHKVRQGYGKGKLSSTGIKNFIANTLQVRLSREKKANLMSFYYFLSRRSFIQGHCSCNGRRWGTNPISASPAAFFHKALYEALDTDPLPTNLPLGLLRVANSMVASRARHIPVVNRDCKSYGVTSAVLLALFDNELQLFSLARIRDAEQKQLPPYEITCHNN